MKKINKDLLDDNMASTSFFDFPSTTQIDQPRKSLLPISHTDFVGPERGMTIPEMQIAGTILLIFSLISILINCYFSVLIFKNWSTFKKSLYYNTNLLCLLLTLADLVFIVLLGFPTALHLTWINHFKGNPLMHFYSQKLAFILFKFIFFLRIIIISVLSLDRCLHLLKPVQYSKIATRRRMRYAIGLIFSVPILMELIPTLVVFFLNDTKVVCGRFRDPESTVADLIAFKANFSVPLTCETMLDLTPPGSTFPLFELVVIMTVTILAWLVIVASNFAIILMIVKHAMKPINLENPERRKKMANNLTRSSMMVVFIAALFFATSFPYVWISLAGFIRSHVLTDGENGTLNSKSMFYLTILTFLPVIFHPWLYLLRLKSVQDMTPQFSKNVAKTFSIAVDNIRQYLPLNDSRVRSKNDLSKMNNTDTFRMSPIPRSPRLQPDEIRLGNTNAQFLYPGDARY